VSRDVANLPSKKAVTQRVVVKWAADIVRGAAAEALLTPAFRAYC